MFSRLEQVIDNAVAAGRIVGVVYLVARNGEIIFARERGFADREAGTPVRRNTLFRLASVTKPFVATAALAMMDKGLIRLDGSDQPVPALFHAEARRRECACDHAAPPHHPHVGAEL